MGFKPNKYKYIHKETNQNKQTNLTFLMLMICVPCFFFFFFFYWFYIFVWAKKPKSLKIGNICNSEKRQFHFQKAKSSYIINN